MPDMSFRPPPPPRPSRLDTSSSSHSTTPSSGYTTPMYTLPIESPVSSKVARPGGLAGQAHTRSPPLPPRKSFKSRQSDESIYARAPASMLDGRDSPVPLGRPSTLRRDSSGVLSVKSVGSGRGPGDDGMGPKAADVDLFTFHCRQFYLSSDPTLSARSSIVISSTLAALSPSHRAIYTKIQNTIRASAHLHHMRLRISAFHAQVAGLVPSCSLSPIARGDLKGRRAREERKARLRDFLDKWCSSGNVGTEPFFKGLRATMRVTSRPDIGGTGSKRLVWEIDDAVFQESGGPDFQNEAVTILKGVLGFTDQPLSASPRVSSPLLDPIHGSPSKLPGPSPSKLPSRSGSEQELLADPISTPSQPSSIRTKRPPPPPPPTAAPRRSVDSAGSGSNAGDHAPLLKGRSNSNESQHHLAELQAAEEADLNQPRYRLWTLPAHIDDQEACGLLSLFPVFVSKDARLPLVRPARMVEDATWRTVMLDGQQVARVPIIETESQEGVLRCGTGRMWRGDEDRDVPHEGGIWFRFVRWWKKLFGTA